MKKTISSNDSESHERESKETITSSPRNRTLLKKSCSLTGLRSPVSSGETTLKTKRHSFLFRSAASRKSAPSLKDKEAFEILKKVISAQVKSINEQISESISSMANDHTLITFLLEKFSSVNELLITQRSATPLDLQEELDIYVYQNQPPHLVYLYCKTLMKDESGINLDRSEWLISLMKSSLGGIANTLIFIATQLELSRVNSTPEGQFREDSMANKFSVCCAKASAGEYLETLVSNVIRLVRAETNWPQGYIISTEPLPFNHTNAQNFTRLMVAVSKIIAQVQYEPTLSSIITLRYDLTLSFNSYDTTIATMAARSLFWLRLFLPLFRLKLFSDNEKPTIKIMASLLAKASSGSQFNDPAREKMNECLNNIINGHLHADLTQCFERITSKKSNIIIYDFVKNEWGVWQSLLPSKDVELSLNQFTFSQ
jgi:hypothetical protein